MEYDFDILPRGMENLDDFLVGHQAEERCEVETGRKRIHQCGVIRRSHLDKAQFRPESRFTDELRVDSDEI
jgi:hypothetical protein